MPSRPCPAPTYNLLDWLLDPLLMPGTDLGRIRRTAEALRDHPALLRSALNVLRHDSSALGAMSRRGDAVVHENGFAKVVLSRGDGWRLRLHVWSPWIRPDDHDENPHGHCWSFASWIITGTLHETIFDETHRGQQFTRKTYGRDDDTYFLRAVGTAELAPVEEIDREAGTVYERVGSEVHTAAPRTELVATLVFQGRRTDETTTVFERPGRTEDVARPLTPHELRRLLTAVVDALR